MHTFWCVWNTHLFLEISKVPVARGNNMQANMSLVPNSVALCCMETFQHWIYIHSKKQFWGQFNWSKKKRFWALEKVVKLSLWNGLCQLQQTSFSACNLKIPKLFGAHLFYALSTCKPNNTEIMNIIIKSEQSNTTTEPRRRPNFLVENATSN